MRIALGSDMAGELPEAIDRWLRARDHEVRRYGALAPGGPEAWPSVGHEVGARGGARRRAIRRALLLDRHRRQHRR